MVLSARGRPIPQWEVDSLNTLFLAAGAVYVLGVLSSFVVGNMAIHQNAKMNGTYYLGEPVKYRPRRLHWLNIGWIAGCIAAASGAIGLEIALVAIAMSWSVIWAIAVLTIVGAVLQYRMAWCYKRGQRFLNI